MIGSATTYLSRPSVHLPRRRLSNEDVIHEVQSRYRGSAARWPEIEAGIRLVFERCNSRYRHIEEDPQLRVGDFAATAARACLEAQGVAPGEVDLVIYAGVAREYFEPATAMEVAAACGISRTHAFDVTSACVGQLEGIHVASALLNMVPRYRNALVVSGELTRQFLCYDVQRPEELATKVAGLTIGNAAAAWLVGREPYPGGCAELVAMDNLSLTEHWHLCSAPVDGTFTSRSHELFKLNVHVAPEIQRVLRGAGWAVGDVDHFISHQPSEHMNVKVLEALGADPARGQGTHHLYGNTASTTVALNMHELLARRPFTPGQRLVYCSAAAGFSVVTLLGAWVE